MTLSDWFNFIHLDRVSEHGQNRQRSASRSPANSGAIYAGICQD